MIQPITAEKLLQYREGDICSFLEDQYILESGKPIKLEPVQRKILDDIFQAKDKNGLRIYNDALIGMIKKSGKSTLASGVALYMLFCDPIFDEPNYVYSIAFDKEQASIIWLKTKRAIERNPILLGSVKIYRDEIRVLGTGSSYKVLSAESFSAHGLDPTCVIGDEIWNQKNRDLLDALQFSPTRKQPLRFTVTYAGSGADPSNPLYELYEKGIRGENPKMYFHWSHEPEVSWITKEFIEEKRKELPPAIFQRFWENRWTSGENAFLTREEVMQCIDSVLKMQLEGKKDFRYYLAIDLGLVRDRTVLSIVHKNPEDNLVYLDYVKTYKGTKKNPVLISEVEKDIIWANENFHIVKNSCDVWQMKGSVERLKKIIRIEDISFTSSYIQKLSQNLYFLFHNNLIRISPLKDLETELLNLNCESKSYGWRIDHKSGQFSDHVISLGIAALEAVNSGNSTSGIYFGNWQPARPI